MLQGQPTGMPLLVSPLPPSNPACPHILLCSPSTAPTHSQDSSCVLCPAHSSCNLTPSPRGWLHSLSRASLRHSRRRLLTGRTILTPPSSQGRSLVPCPPRGTSHTSLTCSHPTRPDFGLHNPFASATFSPSLLPPPRFQDGSLTPPRVSPPACTHFPAPSLPVRSQVNLPLTASAEEEAKCPSLSH